MKKVFLGVALAMGLAFGVLSEDVIEAIGKYGNAWDGIETLEKRVEKYGQESAKKCLDGDVKVCIRAVHSDDKLVVFDADLPYIDKACDLGDINSCRRLGEIYMAELGYGKKVYFPKHAVAPLEKACKAKDLRACERLGELYSNSKLDQLGLYKPKKTIESFKKSCDSSKVDDDYWVRKYVSVACWNLGVSYENGKFVKANKTKAIEYYQKSCKFGYQKGCRKFRNLRSK